MPRRLLVLAVAALLSCAHTKGGQQTLTAEDFARAVSIPEAAVSPDGNIRAWVSDRTGARELWLDDRRDDGGPNQVTHAAGDIYGIAFAPDGSVVYAEDHAGDERFDLWLIGADQGINEKGFLQLLQVDLAAGTQRFVGPGDWDVEEVVVARNGTIAFVRNVHAESELLLATGVEGLAAPKLLERGGVIESLAIDDEGKLLVTVAQSARQPQAMVCRDLSRDQRWVCVQPDAGGIDLARLPDAQMRTFKSFDGVEIDALVLTPTEGSKPLPAVVLVHGGPNGQTRPRFSALSLAMAHAGFVVISPNYRGSTGYGRAFEDLNNKDWCGGDYKDLVAVAEQMSQAGEIDPKRLAIMGGSYGGYMTLCAVGKEPERWAAAVDMYGMPDLVVDYEMTKDRFGPWYETEMGTPATHPELFKDRSPITRIEQVRTPMLVLQGANDTNVPKAQSDAVVETLKARGVPVDYVVYPNEGHGFTRRENRLDAIDRTVRFLRERLE